MVGRLSLRDVPELPDARKRGDAGLDSPDSGLPPSPGPAHPHWPLSAGSPERAAHGGLPEPAPSASIPAAAVRPGRSGRYGREGREVRSRERRVGPGSGLCLRGGWRPPARGGSVTRRDWDRCVTPQSPAENGSRCPGAGARVPKRSRPAASVRGCGKRSERYC